jgi:hypothetical protein
MITKEAEQLSKIDAGKARRSRMQPAATEGGRSLPKCAQYVVDVRLSVASRASRRVIRLLWQLRRLFGYVRPIGWTARFPLRLNRGARPLFECRHIVQALKVMGLRNVIMAIDNVDFILQRSRLHNMWGARAAFQDLSRMSLKRQRLDVDDGAR